MKIMDRSAPIGKMILRFVVAFIVTAILFFLPAGTIFWWQAWIYLGLFFIPMACIAYYLIKRDRELLQRRLQTKESEPGQAVISHFFYISIGLALVIAAFDRRYGWSNVHHVISIVSALFFLAGYYFLFLVFKENKYLAHTVRVDEDQEVVTTGPYAVVRHPMYMAELIMFAFTPLVLGSYWALVSLILLIPVLVVRIVTEEKLLLQKLKGYRDYILKTKYRLVPGVW